MRKGSVLEQPAPDQLLSLVSWSEQCFSYIFLTSECWRIYFLGDCSFKAGEFGVRSSNLDQFKTPLFLSLLYLEFGFNLKF